MLEEKYRMKKKNLTGFILTPLTLVLFGSRGSNSHFSLSLSDLFVLNYNNPAQGSDRHGSRRTPPFNRTTA